MSRSLHEVQESIGSSGRFGEFFIALGAFIFLGGVVLWVLGDMGVFNGGHVAEESEHDAIVSGVLYVVEGLGFMIFGAVAILSGWDRHHDHEA